MRVLLIDDHALVRRGMEELLRSRGVEIVASAGSGEEGIRLAQSMNPEIILLDIKMPGLSGIDTLNRLRELGLKMPVVMLTMSREDADLQGALRGGAQGYLLKDMDPEELLPALEATLRGDNVVAKEMVGTLARIVQGKGATTEHEYVASGLSNKMIARELNITDGTVKLHVKAILRKLGLHSRVEAAVLAVEHGLGRKRPASN